MFVFIDITQLTRQMKSVMGICRKCKQNRLLILLKTYRCFRIFFIPVWHWDEKYFVTDEQCGAMYEISEEDAILVKYDKKEMSTCLPITEYQTVIRCTVCEKVLEHEYEFCPHCGQKRK